MVEKLADGFFKVKSYWRKPPKGYEVNYKEFVSYAAGAGGGSFLSILMTYTNLVVSTPMMITYFKASSGSIFLLTIIASLFALIRSPLLSMLLDNTRSKKGKFKSHLMWTMVAGCVCLCLIPYVPQSWVGISAIKFTMPHIPYLMGKATTVDINVGLIVMFVLLQISTIATTLQTQCMVGMGQVISSNAQERGNLESIKSLVSGLPASIVNIFLPLLAMAFAAGMNNITLYKIIFPICAVGAILFTWLVVRNTKERVVVPKTHVNKVKFHEGAKHLLGCKYFWILMILTVLFGLRTLSGSQMMMWACLYGIGGDAGNAALSVCNIVLNNAFIPGMLLAPLLIKKFGKKKVLLISSVLFFAVCVLQYFLAFNSYLILVCIFFLNLFGGLSFFTAIMTADVMDYLQYKTGKRLEGFWQNFIVIVSTIITFGTNLLQPIAMSIGGLEFGAVIGDVLEADATIRNNVFKNVILLAAGASAVSIIPILFYNLTEKKHKSLVKALKIRAAVTNYKENTLTDQDVINVHDILLEIQEIEDKIIMDEVSKYDCYEAITKHYDRCFAKLEVLNIKDNLEHLAREIEMEEKRIANRLVRAKKKANKLNALIDEQAAKMEAKPNKKYKPLGEKVFINDEEWIIEAYAKSRFVKDRDKLAELDTLVFDEEPFLLRDDMEVAADAEAALELSPDGAAINNFADVPNCDIEESTSDKEDNSK